MHWTQFGRDRGFSVRLAYMALFVGLLGGLAGCSTPRELPDEPAEEAVEQEPLERDEGAADAGTTASGEEELAASGDVGEGEETNGGEETGGADDYDPCAGKACGERCTVCPPGDADCAETMVLKYCNADGECVSSGAPKCE